MIHMSNQQSVIMIFITPLPQSWEKSHYESWPWPSRSKPIAPSKFHQLFHRFHSAMVLQLHSAKATTTWTKGMLNMEHQGFVLLQHFSRKYRYDSTHKVPADELTALISHQHSRCTKDRKPTLPNEADDISCSLSTKNFSQLKPRAKVNHVHRIELLTSRVTDLHQINVGLVANVLRSGKRSRPSALRLLRV